MFIAEGTKITHEWLSGNSKIQTIIATADWIEKNVQLLSRHKEATLQQVKDSELAALSGLQTPNEVMIIAEMPEKKIIPRLKEWYLALDDVQDPGNMGTIIRIADWFGISHVVCSRGCVDVYNPKVVQSAMGGHLRVNLYEEDLVQFLSVVSLPKIAATLDGTNVYGAGRHDAGVLIIGNESKGISEEVAACATLKVTIPGRGGAESLNAGVSAGILCALLLPI